MKVTKFFESSQGDIYSISLSSENGGLIADDIRQQLEDYGIVVVDIELNRIQGSNTTSTSILVKAEEVIAEFLMSHPNVIICYYCDFLSPLPYVSKSKKDMPVQAYRHRLFSRMFDRYVSQHHIEHVNMAVLRIEGAETYYVHVIARSEHLSHISYISEGIQRDFGKPE
ncbi:MAG: hypothetical protein IJ243_07050 [Prevotella sp.]|nr:hypothetical protein [Prevotella sp.]MBQ8948288.1 hypothetical protein [Prevotella sp.]